MGEDNISYELTSFERLEIVRSEIDSLTEELQEADAKLRAVLYEVERLRFLAGLAKSYTKSEAPEGYSELQELKAKRAEIQEKLAALKAALPKVETEAMSGAAPRAAGTPGAAGTPAPAAGAKGSQRRKGFDSFDDFRRSK